MQKAYFGSSILFISSADRASYTGGKKKMEAAAISAAQSPLSAVVKAKVAVTGEIGLLLGVHEELSFIKEELEMMQAFLRAASAQNKKGETVIVWVKQVCDLAYEVEHCIQEASLHLKQKNCISSAFSVKGTHRIAKKIQVLKTRIEDVSKRNLRYGLITSPNDNGSSPEFKEKTFNRLTTNEEALIVGLEKPIRDVINLILNENAHEHQQLKVISVVGMDGLGKTTLVRKVYGDQEISVKFRCFAWVTVLHPFNLGEFMESLFRQLYPPNSEGVETIGMTKEGNMLAPVLKRTRTKSIKENIEDKVKKYLKDKKYLVVIDDLSNEAEWEEMKPLLPTPDKHTSCRIIVTTRSKNLAKSISHQDDIHIMKPLSNDPSINLFYRTVFKTTKYPLETDDREKKGDHSQEIDPSLKKSSSFSRSTKEMGKHSDSPPRRTTISPSLQWEITEEMKTQASLIVDKCGTLPLAIVTIGSCLASRPKTSGEWKVMHDRLTFEINNNRQLGRIKAVLMTSYDGLPYQLKSCFFYLCVFHNHKEIRRSRIIRRWMAEGYLMERRGITSEEVGEDYFYDLMGRSLIQPSETTTIVNGNVTRCNIHDLIHELIVAKSQEENVMLLLEDQNNVRMNEKVRHLVIVGGGRHTKSNVSQNVVRSHMRSLTIFGMVDTYLVHHFARFLRVLDLEGTMDLKNSHLSRIGDLRFLRYLGLRGTNITKLPTSLENLHDLETLDIRNTVVVELPRGIVKLQKLSYLRAGFDFYKSKSVYGGYPKIEDRYLMTIVMCSLHCFPLLLLASRDRCPRAIQYIICTLYLLTSPHVWPLFGALLCCPEAIYGSEKGKNFGSFGVKAPRAIGKMRSLCNLGMIDIGGSKSIANDMKNLTNLKKLGVTGLSKRNGKRFAAVIKELTQLRTLVLSSAGDSGLSDCFESLESLPSSLKYLRSLKLYSPVNKLPDWISKLENLIKLHLRNTKLEIDNVDEIGKLPNLIILCVSKNSFNGQQLSFPKDTFPNLQALVIERMEDLTLVSFEENSMPRLGKLEITRCRSLCQGGLSGLKHLEELNEILLKYKYYEKVEKKVYNENFEAFKNELDNQISGHAKQPGLRVMRY